MVILLIFLLIIIAFPSRLKQKITGQAENVGTKDVEIMVPLKYLRNFWRTLEMSLINCESNLILTWFANCFLVAGTVANQEPTFTTTDRKLYVPVVNLSIQDNVERLEQLKSDFKGLINSNLYQLKV